MTTIEAAPTLTPMSVEICGNSESETRTIDWLAKDATAKSVMAEVALPPEAVDEVVKVDSGGSGGLSTARAISSKPNDDR